MPGTLNMREQMPRQLKAFGAYSSMLTPYRSRGLLPIPETPAGQRLLSLVDPWAYRERLTMPKLIINGTNDLYWATDALNLYWNGVPNDKWVYYIPNAGHNLRRRDRPSSEQSSDFINALAAFSRHQMSGRPMPKLNWKHENAGGKLSLTIGAARRAARRAALGRPGADQGFSQGPVELAAGDSLRKPNCRGPLASRGRAPGLFRRIGLRDRRPEVPSLDPGAHDGMRSPKSVFSRQREAKRRARP